MSKRVKRWKAAWESRDPEQVLSLYETAASHASALVPRLFPEAGSATLKGTDQIREYFERGLARFTELRFDLLTVTESRSRSAVEYLRCSNLDGDNPAHVLELIEWNGSLIRWVRVFHF
jgi:hypothetical protein